MSASSSFIDRSHLVLKQSGFRVTTPRVRVAQALNTQKKHKPFTVKEIFEVVSQDESKPIEFSTVYRIVDTCAKLGLIHPTPATGQFVVCEGGDSKPSTLHVLYFCKNCDRVSEELIEGRQGQVILSSLDRYSPNFQSDRAVIDIFGDCRKCKGSRHPSSWRRRVGSRHRWLWCKEI